MKNLVIVISVFFFMTIFIDTPLFSHGKNHKMSDKMMKMHWRAPVEARSVKNPISATIASLKTGQSLYEKNCAKCHGTVNDTAEEIEEFEPVDQSDLPENERVQIPPHITKLGGGHHSDGEVYWKISTGNGDMPAWKEKLSSQEMWHLTNYLQSIKKP